MKDLDVTSEDDHCDSPQKSFTKNPQSMLNANELTRLSSKNSLEDVQCINELDTIKEFEQHMDAKRRTNMKYMMLIMRGAAAVIMLLSLFCVKTLPKNPNLYSDGFCLKDNGHIWTESVNELVHQSKSVLSFFEITSSSIMDITMINMMACWYFFGKNGGILWTIAFFYGSRALVQGNFKMRFPDKGIWDDPGIPSLVVPYGLQSDYYFSGHCGFLAINVAYMFTLGRKKSAFMIMLLLPYVAFTLIMSRIHYTIDIPIGIMFGFYLYYMVKSHTEKLDFWISRATICVKNMICAQK